MENKQYVYIGQFYHIRKKELPLDFKFGVTDDLKEREKSIGRTKSPIKYMILRAWKIPSNVSREKVEKLVSFLFNEEKYDGCEWYDIDGETFQDKISTLFHLIGDMVKDSDFSFEEVNLEEDKTESPVIEQLVKDIRSRSNSTNLKIHIDGNLIIGDTAKSRFVEAVRIVTEKVDPIFLYQDFNKIFKENREDFTDKSTQPLRQNQCEKLGDFYLDCHSSTKTKSKYLQDIFLKYGINGSVEIE